MAAILDKVLGEDEGNYLRRSRMKAMFSQYEKQKMLRPEERKILSAALELKTKTVADCMTPLSKAFMLDVNMNLDDALKRTIYEKGFSRIPIYDGDPDNIIGILMARDLIVANIEDSFFTL